MSAGVSAVVFDLGGVLIDWSPRRLFRKLFASEEEVDYFLENICTMTWNEEQDAGRSLEEATQLLVERHPEFRHEIEAYYGRWEEMLGGEISGSVAYLETLGRLQRTRLFALSNWSAETFPIAQQRFGFLDHFEDIVVSGAERLKKPDPRIFDLLLDRHKLTVDSVLFIDDSLRNVSAADAMGMRTIHFQNPVQMGEELQAHGLIPEAHL